jgi:hypothetical protein
VVDRTRPWREPVGGPGGPPASISRRGRTSQRGTPTVRVTTPPRCVRTNRAGEPTPPTRCGGRRFGCAPVASARAPTRRPRMRPPHDLARAGGHPGRRRTRSRGSCRRSSRRRRATPSQSLVVAGATNARAPPGGNRSWEAGRVEWTPDVPSARQPRTQSRELDRPIASPCYSCKLELANNF